MTITIDNAFVENYKGIVTHLAQQKENKLRKFVTEVDSKGESYNFDILAATEALTKSGRRVTTEYVDDMWSRRVAQPGTYTHTMTVEHEDKVQMLINPDNAYAENQAMAMARKWDDIIIAAATSTALDGDGAANSFPGGQVVSDGSVKISFDLITQVIETFLANEIDMDVPKVFVIGPTQVRALLNLTQQTSADYVNREALQKLNATGIVSNWMGFTWLMSNRLLAPDTGEVGCLAFTKRAIGLAVNQNMFTRIGENPAMSYLIQIFAQFTAGAVRVEDEQIVHLRILDSAA